MKNDRIAQTVAPKIVTHAKTRRAVKKSRAPSPRKQWLTGVGDGLDELLTVTIGCCGGHSTGKFAEPISFKRFSVLRPNYHSCPCMEDARTATIIFEDSRNTRSLHIHISVTCAPSMRHEIYTSILDNAPRFQVAGWIGVSDAIVTYMRRNA